MIRPLLYTYRRCPYAMRARMALLASGIAFDGFEIVLRNKPAEMLAISPKGTVPVLVLPDGSVQEQSWDIIRWAFVLSDDRKGCWNRAQSPENLNLLANNDGVFKHHLDRYKYPERFGETDRAVHRDQAMTHLLHPLEERLQRKPYLGGNTPCATDIAVLPFVRQFAAVNSDWFSKLPIPSVQTWLANWVVSPLFVAGMVKLPSQSIVLFPPPAQGTTSFDSFFLNETAPRQKTRLVNEQPRGKPRGIHG
jgi:glutathione S-transferase